MFTCSNWTNIWVPSEFQKISEIETQSKKVFYHQDSLQLNQELSGRTLPRLPLTASNQKGFKIQQHEYKQSFTASKNWPNSLQNKARQQQSHVHQLQMLTRPLYSNVQLLSLWSYKPFGPEHLKQYIVPHTIPKTLLPTAAYFYKRSPNCLNTAHGFHLLECKTNQWLHLKLTCSCLFTTNK